MSSDISLTILRTLDLRDVLLVVYLLVVAAFGSRVFRVASLRFV